MSPHRLRMLALIAAGLILLVVPYVAVGWVHFTTAAA